MTDRETQSTPEEKRLRVQVDALRQENSELKTALSKALDRREHSAFKNTMMPERFGERLPDARL